MRFKLTSILAAAVSFGAAHSASAADLPARMVTKAPAMVIADSWSGIYIGGHIGGAWSRTGVEDPTGALAPVGTSIGLNSSSFLGGGQVGVNWQFSNWVFGVQGDFSATDLNASAVAPLVATTTGTYKTDWIATATARLGYTWSNWLTYVKGGGAWAHNKFSLVDPVTALNATGSDTRSGYTVGAGVERGFAPGWSAFLEYDYLNFGNRSVTATDAVVGALPATIKQEIHMVKAGVNFRLPPPR